MFEWLKKTAKAGDAPDSQGCKFSASAIKANTHTASSECQMQGVPVRSQSVVMVESDSAYKVQLTASGGGRSTRGMLALPSGEGL